MKFTSFTTGVLFESDKSTYKTYACLCTVEMKTSAGKTYLKDKLIVIKTKLSLEMDFKFLVEVILDYKLWEDNFGMIEIYIDDKQLNLINWVIKK